MRRRRSAVEPNSLLCCLGILQLMQNQLYHIQQQLQQQRVVVDGYPGNAGSVPGSSSSYADSPDDSTYSPRNSASRVLNISVPPAIAYRPILPSDLEVLKEIHEDLFPIKYEPEFFTNVVHRLGIISWAAVDANRSDVHRDELVGFVTSRVVTATEAGEADLLGYEYGNTGRTLMYILTLGVVRPYRNCGIASALIGEVIGYASSMSSCRAVYLHVISYNKPAILFYEKNSFQCLRKLHNFYYINGQYYDAYVYVFYVNGGRSPCTAIDFLAALGALVSNFISSLSTKLFRRNVWNSVGKWAQKHKDLSGPISPTRRIHGPDSASASLFV